MQNLRTEFYEELHQRDKKIELLEKEIKNIKEGNSVSTSPVHDNIADFKEKCVPFDKKPRRNKVNKDLVFVGDSIIKHVNMNLLNKDKENELCCFPGANVLKIRNELVNIESKFNIKRLVLHMGTNCIPKDTTDVVASKLLHVIKEIRLHMPETKLYVSAILPKITKDYNPGINAINLQLYRESIKMGFFLIQHPQFSQNSILSLDLFVSREVLNKRPLHLNHRGVATLACNIKYALRTF